MLHGRKNIKCHTKLASQNGPSTPKRETDVYLLSFCKLGTGRGGGGWQTPGKDLGTHSTGEVSASVYLSELRVRSIHRDRYTTSSQSPTTYYKGTGSILDQGRRDVCKQRIITTKARKIFSRFPNKPYNYGITYLRRSF